MYVYLNKNKVVVVAETSDAQKKKVASVLQRSAVRQSNLCQKEREQSRLSRASDCEVGESPSEREPHDGERERERGIKRDYGEEKVDSTVKEDRFQGGEGGQAQRTSVGEVEGSMSR